MPTTPSLSAAGRVFAIGLNMQWYDEVYESAQEINAQDLNACAGKSAKQPLV